MIEIIIGILLVAIGAYIFINMNKVNDPPVIPEKPVDVEPVSP